MRTLVISGGTQLAYELHSQPVDDRAAAEKVIEAYFNGEHRENKLPYHDVKINDDWQVVHGQIAKYITARQCPSTQPDRFKATLI